MDFLIFSLSLLTVYIGLAQMLHIQFGLVGIPNFGIVGFWGIGLYGTGILHVEYDVSLFVAIAISSLTAVGTAYILARLILDRSGQAILAATLAFATIVQTLIISEKELTGGVQGLGTIGFPLADLEVRNVIFLALLIVVTALMIFLSAKLRDSRLGRQLVAIRDNEELASSLGKNTGSTKRLVFAATCGVMGLLGGLSAPLHQFLVPYQLEASVTFAVWIALVLGGKGHNFGAMLGVFVTFGLFEILVEIYVPVPVEQAILLPNFKLFCYGLLLVGIIMFRPIGLLGLGKLKDQGKPLSTKIDQPQDEKAHS